MKKLAIVFFHMGYSPYQKLTLDLAVKRCPNADVVLITDSPDKEYPEGVHVFDMNAYHEIINKFDSIYDHRNTCKRYFNFRGILRWLIYYEWWKNKINYNLFVADSDVMIFSDLSDEALKWRCYSHTLSMGTAGGQSYWFHIGAMQRLVEIIWNTYTNPQSESALEILSHYDKLQSEGRLGGVCDMTFLAASANSLNLPVGETSVVKEGSTYDHNILMPQEYVFNSQRKEVEWKNGVPYCRLAENNDVAIKFHTLHMSCSGGLIGEYYNRAMGVV